jgi:hypothetical protein
MRLHLDAQVAGWVARRRADPASMKAVQRHGMRAAGQAHAVGDLGDGAYARELVSLAGHEDHALLVADVDRQRHGHVREDDRVVDRDQQKVFHVGLHAYDV